MTWLFGSAILAAAAILGMMFVLRLAGGSRADERVAEFAPERYEPAARLLADEDFEFLRNQPGYTKRIGKKFAAGRRRIFRMYVRQLARDFERTHAEARRAVAESPQEYAPLVNTLLRQQAAFWWAMAIVELRLAMPLFGRADLSKAVGAVQAIRMCAVQ